MNRDTSSRYPIDYEKNAVDKDQVYITSSARPGRLREKISWYFFGLVAGMMLIVLATVAQVLISELRSELKVSLLHKELEVAGRIEQRLTDLSENITNFSQDHFVINNMVHPQGREEYLSKRVADFSKLQGVSTISIVDYTGNMIQSSSPSPPDYKKILYLRPVLDTAERLFDLSKDGKSIHVIEPIQYYDTPIGAVIAAINIEDFLSRILPDNEAEYYKLVAGENTIYSHNFQGEASYIVVSTSLEQRQLPLLSRLQVRFEMGKLESIHLKPVRTVINRLILISILFILIVVAVSTKLSSSLARPILNMVDKTVKSEDDPALRFSPLGTGDELEILAEALDKRDYQLREYQNQLEEKVEKRTADLEQEIAERLQAEQQLRLSEEKVRAIVDNIVDGIITINDRGTVETFNPSAEKIFLYQASEVIGNNVKMLMPEPYQSRHDSFIDNYKTTRDAKIIGIGREVSGKRKDGTTFPMDLAVGAMQVDEQLMFVGIIRDITERKLAEQELRAAKEQAESANLAKSEFLANMSHEIRTPMNAVLGFSDLLFSQETDPKHKGYLQTIQAAGKGLLTIINDILDLSKIEAGRLELQYEYVQPKTIFEEIKQIFAQKTAEKNLEFLIDANPDLPPAFFLDEVRLRQVLLNLVGNAVKFTDNGHVRLSARFEPMDDEGETGTLFIGVEDTGLGVPLEQQEAIFESFRQQDSQSTKKYGGTGLGLTISRRLVEMMNGQIGLTSTVGHGSIFEVILQDVKASAQEPDIDPEHLTFDAGSIVFTAAKVLVADDIQANRDLLKEALAETDLEIHEAVDGIEAEEMAHKLQPDLILMDIRMPKQDGYTATDKIKKNQGTKHIPIIAFTTSITLQERARLTDYGFDGTLSKPVKVSSLLQELARFLEHSKGELESKQDTGVNGYLTAEGAVRLPELVTKLEQDMMPVWQGLSGAIEIDAAEQFGSHLAEIAEDHQAVGLKRYASLLLEATDNFDVEQIQKLIREFPSLIELLTKGEE